MTEILGYLRADGSKGIRNVVLVVYTVECARHVATLVGGAFDEQVQVIGFGGCYPNDYAYRILNRLTTHPNVGAVLLVSLGCEGFNRNGLRQSIESTGREVATLVIQENGGTRSTTVAGQQIVGKLLKGLADVPRATLDLSDLVIGTICGGSDSTSGLTANPAVGVAFDALVDSGARAIFEETGELIGCEQVLAARAVTPALAEELVAAVEKAERYYRVLGHGSFAPGNADGGLTTIEEKSLGAYSKSGSRPIVGMLKPGDIPTKPGLYLLDVVPDGVVRWGFPNINDNAEIAELMACGAHIIVFTTGRGSVVGSAIAPVIKVCANPDTYRKMSEDMDIDAGKILEGKASHEEVAKEILDQIRGTAAGAPTASELLGHQEFVLTYKSFEPAGPRCLPLLGIAQRVDEDSRLGV